MLFKVLKSGMAHYIVTHFLKKKMSVESQKGAITIQRSSIENQKDPIPIDIAPQ